MQALLLVAHGSRRAASNREVETLASALAPELEERFPVIEVAFLELADPDIATGIRSCIDRGARSVVVVPYFLAAGTHVTEDLPALVEAARAVHPGTTFTIAGHVGAAPMMHRLILQCATERV